MDEDTGSIDSLSLRESVDFDYLKEMYQYEINAQKDTELIEISADEENQIICKIKEDILKNVREEMESELEKYQLITDRTNTTIDALQSDSNEHLDPVIRKGLLEIKKLDKILLRKIQKEKEVKRERILLQKRLREELIELENNHKQISKEAKNITSKFLALKPPLRHNEGINEETAEYEIPKLFQTEINNEDPDSTNNNIHKSESLNSECSSRSPKRQQTKSNNSKSNQVIKNAEVKTDNRSSSTQEAGNKEKNFIKRNIELACKASEPVLLTDTEKKRLEFLLSDLDASNDDEVSVKEGSLSLVSEIEENPFQIVTLDRFTQGTPLPSASESRYGSALSECTDITSLQYQLSVETRLKMYMGDESYKQLSRIEERSNFDDSVSYRMLPSDDLEIDIESLGEKSLKEVKYFRETQKRLHEIDEDLSKLKNSEYDQIDDKSLQILLSSSRNSLSRSGMSSVTDVNSDRDFEDQQSESQSEFKVATLSRDILDSLLEEARLCGINPKKLNSIMELNEYDDNMTYTNMSDLEIPNEAESSRNKSEKSSRFPDINLYKQMTSPPPNIL